MLNLPININRQVIVILESSSVPPGDYQDVQLDQRVTWSNWEFTVAMNIPERQTLRVPVTSAGIIGQAELSQDYLELGEALSEMVELEEDEWRIDKSVYATACYIAAGLKAAHCQAPRIFNHGPKSVVFNWSVGTNNGYLTISSNRISTLASSPERIERRRDYPANQLPNLALLLSSIQPGHQGQAFALIRAKSDPPELFD